MDEVVRNLWLESSNQEFLPSDSNDPMAAFIEFAPSIGEEAIKADSVVPISTVAAMKKCGVSFSLVILETKLKPFVSPFLGTKIKKII